MSLKTQDRESEIPGNGDSHNVPSRRTPEKNGHSVDPTRNVLDLVLAAVQRLDDLAAAAGRRGDDLRTALDRRVTELNEQRDGFDQRMEQLRMTHQTQLEAIKSDFGKQIAEILARQTEKSATLLSTQVAATTDRLAVVEKNQYVGSGQSAVRDPAITGALIEVQTTLAGIKQAQDSSTGSRGGAAAQNNLFYMVAVIGISAAGFLASFFIHH
jgi:hypothetical protein